MSCYWIFSSAYLLRRLWFFYLSLVHTRVFSLYSQHSLVKIIKHRGGKKKRRCCRVNHQGFTHPVLCTSTPHSVCGDYLGCCSSGTNLLFFFFLSRFLTVLQLTNWTRMAVQQASGILLWLPSHCWEPIVPHLAF